MPKIIVITEIKLPNRNPNVAKMKTPLKLIKIPKT